jgi:Cu-Zn family superoxide dismutase
MTRSRAILVGSWAAISTLVACGGRQPPREQVQGPTADMSGSPTDPASEAHAEIRDATGRTLGTVELRSNGNVILLTGSLRGVPPGSHGLHLHNTGRCDPPFESAGAHWNPTNRSHGLENPQGPHLGDLANLDALADSVAVVRTATTGGTLRGPNGLLEGDGAAVVLHARPDDNKTDPSGNSGARIACGVVAAAEN